MAEDLDVSLHIVDRLNPVGQSYPSDYFEAYINDLVEEVNELASKPVESNTASNLGTGEGVFFEKVGNDLRFKSLKAGTNITLNATDEEIEINASGSGEANTASNVGSGSALFKQKSGVDLQFRTLTQGSGVTLNQTADEVEISATAITFFQVQDDGTTGQLTTGAYQTLQGIWDTPTLTDSNFTFNAATGLLTVNADGVIEFDIKVTSWQDAVNNRHQLGIELLKNGATSLVQDEQYASRNNNQDEGSAYIVGFKDSVSSGDTYEVRVKDVGVAATVGAPNVANMTYISVKHYG